MTVDEITERYKQQIFEVWEEGKSWEKLNCLLETLVFAVDKQAKSDLRKLILEHEERPKDLEYSSIGRTTDGFIMGSNQCNSLWVEFLMKVMR